MMITLMRNADRVKVGCLAQLVNVIAPIMTANGGPSWRQTIFYPFLHASRFGRGRALRLEVKSDKYDDADAGAVPYLESVATLSEDGKSATVFAVNRGTDEPLSIEADARALGMKRVKEHIVLESRGPQGNEHARSAGQSEAAYEGKRLPQGRPPDGDAAEGVVECDTAGGVSWLAAVPWKVYIHHRDTETQRRAS